ncbi:MAG TPA: alcohol dehydrogenase catalytic domain-containing protein, partial [Streptosporangiaceae bacterium]
MMTTSSSCLPDSTSKCAAGFTPGELDWPGTWTDRAGRDRTPSVPGHELSGVVSELGYGTTGLTVGQRVFGLADWTRDGS